MDGDIKLQTFSMNLMQDFLRHWLVNKTTIPVSRYSAISLPYKTPHYYTYLYHLTPNFYTTHSSPNLL